MWRYGGNLLSSHIIANSDDKARTPTIRLKHRETLELAIFLLSSFKLIFN